MHLAVMSLSYRFLPSFVFWGLRSSGGIMVFGQRALEPSMRSAVHGKDAPVNAGFPPLVLRLAPAIEVSEDQFFELARINRDLRIERNAKGELIVMPPTGGETGDRNSELNMQLRLWAKRDGGGRTFDSSTGFILPNGAVRSPDTSWVENSRLEALSAEQRERFLPLCPDFVIELLSPSDRLEDLQEKMSEYIENGTRLGWLIDPRERRVHVYRPGAPVRRLDDPEKVSGEAVLPGFALEMGEVW